MSKEYLNLNDIEFAERKFHSSKSSIALNDVDFHKTLISEKFGNAKNGSLKIISSISSATKIIKKCLSVVCQTFKNF